MGAGWNLRNVYFRGLESSGRRTDHISQLIFPRLHRMFGSGRTPLVVAHTLTRLIDEQEQLR